MQVRLDRSRPLPLARQIRAHLEGLIREGQLAPGVKLPATREMARTLGVNRHTVAVAYDDLVAAGWARAHVGQGTFVAEWRDARRSGSVEVRRDGAATPDDAAGSAVDWSTLLSRSARIIARDEEERRRAPAVPTGDDALVSFAGGMPDSALFPTDSFRRVLNQVIREEGEALLQYHPAAGYPPLRRYLATYLAQLGVDARPEEILVVNGSQQGFDLIARTFLDAGDAVAIEQPTYPRAMEVFRACGAQLLGVPWDGDGPRADALERLLTRHRPKFFYCQPSAHNPTGLRMTPEAGRRLLLAAARHQVPIVEDGFGGSLGYGRRPATPLKAADRDGYVIYIGTFSKVLFPGLRLGWLVAQPDAIERLEAAKQVADLHTSALIQAAVLRFCERGLLDRHVIRVGGEYARRRGVLLAALRRRMPKTVTWTEPSGGFALLLTLPAGLSAAALLPRALERGVAFTPGSAFFVDGKGERTLRLSFSSVSAAIIDEGIGRLAETIAEAMRRPERPTGLERAAVPLL